MKERICQFGLQTSKREYDKNLRLRDKWLRKRKKVKGSFKQERIDKKIRSIGRTLSRLKKCIKYLEDAYGITEWRQQKALRELAQKMDKLNLQSSVSPRFLLARVTSEGFDYHKVNNKDYLGKNYNPNKFMPDGSLIMFDKQLYTKEFITTSSGAKWG